ncbi:zinc finger family protein, partial [Genlisea aurea]
QQTPRRKRRRKTSEFSVEPAGVSRPAARRPDPHAPNITTPCPECYRTFWSWKALFGHMRCHPKRQYRGINPPENFHRRQGKAPAEEEEFKAEDYEVASYLLMLANGPPMDGPHVGRFVCSSCKRVFNSHQALGGHRASHKNVKGCYAITKNDDDDGAAACCSPSSSTTGHKCVICQRIFTSGQALGGHLRCHWEKAAE